MESQATHSPHRDWGLGCRGQGLEWTGHCTTAASGRRPGLEVDWGLQSRPQAGTGGSSEVACSRTGLDWRLKYDCKEHKFYSKDTPCTYAIQFTIVDNKLNMAVLMRSNDLWYGFCNDQYCFSMIQKLVADELNIEVGEYYHYAHNLHLYNDKI